MPNPDRKVYQSDLTDEIRAIAHTYVSEYVGNFDMMIEARRYYATYGCLSEGMYRPVLNTLRTDVMFVPLWQRVKAMLNHPSHFFAQQEPEYQGEADVIPMSRKRPERTEERPTRITFFDKPFKMKYATTVHKAKHPVIHLMQDKCDIEWWRTPYTKGRHSYPDTTKPLTVICIKPKSYCGRVRPALWYADRPSARYWNHLPTIGEAWEGYATTEEGMVIPNLCRTCSNAYYDQHGVVYVP